MSENQALFSAVELSRYAKHIKLDAIGLAGQQKLKTARVLCVGAGGLGSPLLLYLVAAGIGTLGIIDDDVIALDNLQRQILYKTKDINIKKVLIAKEQLIALNPHVNIEFYSEKLSWANAQEIINQYDIVADCSDNFTIRYLINDVCFYLQKPFVSASISQFAGQCSLFLGKEGPCYRCLFPLPAEEILSCDEGGVLGVLPGLLGTIQATEIIKWILQVGELLSERLLVIDSLKMQFREFRLQKNPECPCCVQKKSLTELTVKINCDFEKHGVSVCQLKKLLKTQAVCLLDVRTLEEHNTFNLGGMLIPLAELSKRLNELDKDQIIVTYCHTGNRSKQAVKMLVEANFKSVKFLQGGCVSWGKESS